MSNDWHRTVWDRVYDKISPEPNSGCWLWLGNVTDARTPSRARARICVDGRMVLVSRLMLGLVDPGLQACHRCDNALCVNPAHLFIGTAKDNSDDMIEKGRARHDLRTHCLRGHEFTQENSRPNGDGKRVCAICGRERSRRAMEKLRADPVRWRKSLDRRAAWARQRRASHAK